MDNSPIAVGTKVRFATLVDPHDLDADAVMTVREDRDNRVLVTDDRSDGKFSIQPTAVYPKSDLVLA